MGSRFLSVAIMVALIVAESAWITGPAAANEPDLPSPESADSLALRELYRTVIALDGGHDARVTLWARTHAAHLHAGFLFDLSRRLLDRDPAQALEWYAVASLRGAYDSRACTDRGVPQIVSSLSHNGAAVLAHARSHPRAYADAAVRALARPDLFSVRGSLCLPMDAAINAATAQDVRDEFGSQFDPMAPSPVHGGAALKFGRE